MRADNTSLQNSSFSTKIMRSGELAGLPQHEVHNKSFHEEHYPEINCDIFNSPTTLLSGKNDSWRSVLMPVHESGLKRIIRTFFESGFQEALNEAREPNTAASNPIIATFAEYTYATLNTLQQLRVKIFPHLKEQTPCSIAKYMETRNWTRSYIRCITWHPNCFKIAVAGCDDIVRIYSDVHALVPVLKSSNQKWITAMAWRPYSAAELAVGCQQGVLLWTIDNNNVRTSSQEVFLKHANHCPITSLQWNAAGTLLATASISDADIIIWNVDLMQNTALKRVGPPCSLLKWSPNDTALFSATVGSVFRVWNVDNCWTPERWTINMGHIQSACWSPCSSFLLFITSADALLYRLQFFEEQLFAAGANTKIASPIADLSKCTFGNHEIGGQPQALAWDASGSYLAIIFKDSPCIAIYTTRLQKFNFSISPSCFISGNATNAEFPTTICFQSNTKTNSKIVLTIAWSSGRLQYFPFNNLMA